MRDFKSVSIKHRLTLIAILPVALTLLVTGLVFFVIDEITLKRNMIQDIAMLSRIIGANNSAAVMFSDQKSAEDNLAVLSADPHVISACIYNSTGAVFAGYTRKKAQSPQAYPPPEEDGYRFSNDSLSNFTKITLNDVNVGTVYLKYDLETIYSRRRGYVTVSVVIILAGISLVLIMSSLLRKAISDPLLKLAETAKAISQGKDYSIRAEGQDSSEIGVLINGFNDMLEQIQERDAKLARHREELEQQVAVRTAELKASNDTLRVQMDENARIEEELFKTRQLESLGVLAGGIAHDFNNLLAAILMNTSLAKKYSPPESKAFSRLEGVENACLRAKDLTQQLLTFSKGGAPVTKVTSIADLIADTARFVFRGSKSRCSFEICDDLWPVEVDEGQISQVINNLAINADQAMPDGGTVLIATENITVKPDSKLSLEPGRYIRISITDTGIGIPRDHLAKIFTPYFTTKKTGNGLGLATSYSIIVKHRGLITVESEPGVGTTFRIHLPASEHKPADAAATVEAAGEGHGRVLVMDDDELVLAVVGEALTNAGYRTECVPGGSEAIEAYLAADAAGDPFDLLIVDLTIPGGMGGVETISRLLAMKPGVKAIAASGYAQGTVMSDYGSYGFMGVLPKPFSIDELCRMVHQVISIKAG